MSERSLAGRTALITGSTSGIGLSDPHPFYAALRSKAPVHC
jgi:short-subunit dehydrogenase involved in D-alanine esterification of teichoic acids